MQTSTVTEADIFAQAVTPPDGNMSRESAETILKWRFPQTAHDEMRELLQKNSDDTITPAERDVLDRYLRVGQMIDILQAQARLVLTDET